MGEPAPVASPEIKPGPLPRLDWLRMPDLGKVAMFAGTMGVAAAFMFSGDGKARAGQESPSASQGAKIGNIGNSLPEGIPADQSVPSVEQSAVSGGQIDKLGSFVTTQLQDGSTISIKPGNPDFTSESFTIITKPAAKVSVNTGTDLQNLVPTTDRTRVKHNITVSGLSPNTTYYDTVTVTPAKGKPKTVRLATFKTAIPGSAPATVTTANRKFLLNGRPFFPIMNGYGQFNPCPSPETTSGSAGLGARIFDASDEGLGSCLSQDPTQWAQTLHSQLNGLWLRERKPAAEQQLRSQGLPELLGWQAVYQEITSPSPQAFENPCLSSTRLFQGVSDASKSKAVIFGWSLATHPILPSRTTCVTPENSSMAFWTVVAAGSQGIGYSTSNAGNGSYFDVSNELAAQAALQANQEATLGPVILTGKKIPTSISPESPVRLGAWRYGGGTYIVAVNTNNEAIQDSFSVPDLSGAVTSANVMWENRRLKVAAGAISDMFAPQAVHIYKMLPLVPQKK